MTDNGIGKYYFYDLRGRLAKISSASDGTGTQTLYTYDNYGNRISDGNRSYTWTRGRLLASAGSATYTYDHNGIRSKKVYGGKTTEYLYDGGKLLHESGGDSTITYFYDVEGINAARIDEQYLIVVTDLDGSVRYIAGSLGQIIAQYKYDAYGRCKVYKQDNTEDTDMSSLGNRFPLRWKGYYYDRETGLYYADGRYYDPEVGQYLDAIEIPEAISEKYLDRNGILCDNILELMPYMYSVLVNMAKDSASSEADSWNMPWWGKLLIGLGMIVAGALVTALTAGTGSGFGGFISAFGSAMLTSLQSVAVSTAISVGISTFIGDITGGTSGAVEGFFDGLIDGFMWGGIFAGGAQILSGVFKLYAETVNRFNQLAKAKASPIFSPDRLKGLKEIANIAQKGQAFYDYGGTIVRITKMIHIDVSTKSLLHLAVFGFKHIPIGTIISGLLGGIL